jgi:hypothetical protein
MPNSNYTLVITSCNRHDLLQVTLESFFSCIDIEPREVLIVEDSTTPMPEWLNTDVWRTRCVRWLQNECRMGQIYSIDRAYGEVKTDYIFHCEDDWKFTMKGDIITKSKQILEQFGNVIMVSLRGDTGWHPLMWDNRFSFAIAEPYWRECWGGLAFNPGLRRLADYKRIGSYGKHTAYGTHGLGHESHLSKMHLDMGYVIADLGKPYIEHIGDGRSRAIEPLENRMPKILIAVPACFKFEYGAWESELSPSYDPAKAWEGRPYGKDIHISGKNDRIEAVRETWAKDIEPFKEHVTLKFFYGKPDSGVPRELLEDEVLLPCPDDYEHLPHKTIEIARYAVRENYDFVFKCDDDTAVHIDRLVHECLSNRFDYAGYEHSGICTGGPGYWLSRRACQEVARNGNPDCWAEDVWVGKTLMKVNIYALMFDSHRPGHSAHWFFGDTFDPTKEPENTVTMHAIQPEVMREWWKHKEGLK